MSVHYLLNALPPMSLFDASIVLPFLAFLGVVVAQVANPPPSARRAVDKRRARDLKVRANVRRTFPPESDLRALARSCIKGLIHPLIILADGTILDGECRYRGMMLEDPDFEFDVIVVERELSPAEVCEMQMISAMHSTSLSAYDQAVACREWMEKTPGATVKELGEKIDRDPSMVGKLLSLWRTTPATIKAASEGLIGPKAWNQISLLPDADRDGLLQMYLSGVPVAQIAEIGRKKRVAATASTVKSTRLRCDLQGGICVLVTGDGVSLEDGLEALAAATKAMRSAIANGFTAKTFSAAQRDKAGKA